MGGVRKMAILLMISIYRLQRLIVSGKSSDKAAVRIGTIPLLRQQGNWVGGVRKMAIFLDVQYYADLECVNGWVGQEKSKNLLR